MSKIVKVKEV
jgi:hypothetical protein